MSANNQPRDELTGRFIKGSVKNNPKVDYLRDIFAGMMMKSITGNYQLSQDVNTEAYRADKSFEDEVAERSYEMADAMIRAREA